MSQDLKDINIKRESTASKRVVKFMKFEPHAQSKSKINKIQISFFALLLILAVVVFAIIYIYAVNKSDTTFNQQLNELSNSPPPDRASGKQDKWASAQIDSLQKSKLSKSSNKDELAAYYNKLFTYYTMSNRTQEAKDLYVNEVKSRNIFLQVAILEWLLSTLSTDDVQLKKFIIDDLLSLLKQQLGDVESADKTEIEAKINYYEKAREVVK